MSINSAFESFPTLETQNLLLRRIIPSDSAAFFKILADVEVTRYYDDDPYTDISQANEQIMSWENGYKNRFCIRWGIAKKVCLPLASLPWSVFLAFWSSPSLRFFRCTTTISSSRRRWKLCKMTGPWIPNQGRRSGSPCKRGCISMRFGSSSVKIS